MSETAGTERAVGGTSLAWVRRRESAARFWRGYRAHRSGLYGLAALALIGLAALAAPLLVGGDVQSVTRAEGGALEPPSAAFWLGTDQFGRSLLGLLVWGARVSLAVGLLAAGLSVAIGAVVGIAAGHFGGWFATVGMRGTDWFLGMPALVLAIVLATVLSRSMWEGGLAIGITRRSTTARRVRGAHIAVEA
ncbi:ABC transporter permease, partial [Streptomyces solincola]